MADKVIDNKQIFISNLPFDTKKEEIEEFFSEVGPIKRSFIVTKKDDKTKCTGNAFLWFALADHAKEAIKSFNNKKFKNRSIKVEQAKPKREDENNNSSNQRDNKRNNNNNKKVDEKVEKVEKKEETKKDNKIVEEIKVKKEEVVVEESATPKPLQLQQQPLQQQQVAIAINNFEIKDKNDFAASLKVKPGLMHSVKRIPFSDNTTRIYCWNDKGANELLAKLATFKHNGKPLIYAKETNILLSHELVIRNLNFTSNISHVNESFKKFGQILWVKVPTKQTDAGNQQVSKGFAFVLFSSRDSAQNAMDQLNGKPLNGRNIAIDWAIPQEAYKSYLKSRQEEQRLKEEQENKAKKQLEGEDEEEDEDVEEEEEEDNKKEKTVDFDSEEEKENFNIESDKEGEDEEDAEDEDDAEEGEGEDEDGMEMDEEFDEDEMEDMDDEDMDDDDMGDFDETKQDRIERERKERLASKEKNKKEVGEGKTLFIRNVSFDTTQEDLEKKFSEFGKLKFCRLVLDPTTEKPTGKAFVKYLAENSANAALEAAKVTNLFDPTKDLSDNKNAEKQRAKMEKKQDFSLSTLLQGGIMVHGRNLIVDVAVDHEKAGELKDNRVAKVDKKNKALLLVGKVLQQSELGQLFTEKDWNMRSVADREANYKLKVNPNYYVSPTRLCFRNLPLSVSDKQLKLACQKALKAKSNKSKIFFAKVAVDKERVNANGKAKSKGYGFVEFEDHQAALDVIHSLNNSTKVFTGQDKKEFRTFIQFSIEDARVVKKQKEIQERIVSQNERRKQQLFEEKKEKRRQDKESGVVKEKEKGRGAKQREKKRLMREKLQAAGINPESVNQKNQQQQKKDQEEQVDLPQHVQEKMLRKLKKQSTTTTTNNKTTQPKKFNNNKRKNTDDDEDDGDNRLISVSNPDVVHKKKKRWTDY
ncbi:hypothetical protein PPL_01328 [Heterostelium album PN500]|uniref:RRM domain-containing protein n=1 Tax=Heterostelium pallidum (strain ATCC 26659 / Pp 5 / PN500) TaxID=670386 RepID=D3AYR4_HETP5|nr:hypothetical protein PPL_01328 [Heterostelium album PN500]EFA86091.1 hypothetical protein PPL_01328 [Heterostelium album PN500]|eukprot:XP_020438197.1 hypothetical protein PPL_01328 [Heterostelium album PN500]